MSFHATASTKTYTKVLPILIATLQALSTSASVTLYSVFADLVAAKEKQDARLPAAERARRAQLLGAALDLPRFKSTLASLRDSDFKFLYNILYDDAKVWGFTPNDAGVIRTHGGAIYLDAVLADIIEDSTVRSISPFP